MDIIMVPFHDFKKWENEGFRTRDAHLYEHFCNDKMVDRILVVNRPTSLAELIIKREPWYSKKGKIIYKRQFVCLTQKSEKSYCIDILLPDTIKVAVQKKAWWFTAFQYKKVANEINAAIECLRLTNTVLLLQNPMAIGTVKGVKHSKFVFDAIDNWLFHPQMKDKELIKTNYHYVETHADLILTVSEALKSTFVKASNVQWQPNGVDVEYFKQAFNNSEGSDLCVGYVGKIQNRVDFDLVEACLKEVPYARFTFLGPVYSQQERVKKLTDTYSNVEFMGDIHYSKLPEKLKNFSVAIIPHKIDDFTNSMNPLKLYEYLAAGKQVVTTSVAGADGISPFVYIAKDEQEFINLIKKVLDIFKSRTTTPQIIADSIPEECTWSYRTKCILNEIAKLK